MSENSIIREIAVTITPEEAGRIVAAWDSRKQVAFLNALAEVDWSWSMQAAHITDNTMGAEDLTPRARALLKTFAEYAAGVKP